jgi:hypothetical protein
MDLKADLDDSGFAPESFRFRSRTILCQGLHSSTLQWVSSSGRRSLAIHTLGSSHEYAVSMNGIVYTNTEAIWIEQLDLALMLQQKLFPRASIY